jgi:hypothetical protein
MRVENDGMNGQACTRNLPSDACNRRNFTTGPRRRLEIMLASKQEGLELLFDGDEGQGFGVRFSKPQTEENPHA